MGPDSFAMPPSGDMGYTFAGLFQQVEMSTCKICGALVSTGNQMTHTGSTIRSEQHHTAWHRTIDDALHQRASFVEYNSLVLKVAELETAFVALLQSRPLPRNQAGEVDVPEEIQVVTRRIAMNRAQPE